jgi:hypothetical protein
MGSEVVPFEDRRLGNSGRADRILTPCGGPRIGLTNLKPAFYYGGLERNVEELAGAVVETLSTKAAFDGCTACLLRDD